MTTKATTSPPTFPAEGTTSGQATQSSAADQSAPRLTGRILQTGMIYEDKVLIRVILEWEGGKIESELPDPDDEAEGVDGGSLRDRILGALRNSPIALNRKQLARMLGLKSVRGRFGREVSAMDTLKLIRENAGFYSDDVSKFDVED